MAFPPTTLTYYRMPDVALAAATGAGMIDALFTALSSAVDYRGTALAATHLWSFAKHQNAGVSDCVYVTSVPAGTSMTLGLKMLWVAAAAGAPTMASPDTFAANVLLCGVNKNSGAFNGTGQGWDQALPFTSGQFFGYWRSDLVAANAVGTVIRAYISQETVFIQIIQAATTQYWCFCGAIGAPFDADTTNSAEADNRLYGVAASGGLAVVNASWQVNNSAWPGHATTANSYHAGLFNPGAGTIQTLVRAFVPGLGVNSTMMQTPSGVYVASPTQMLRGNITAAGTVSICSYRGIYPAGQIQSGRELRNGTIDLYHVIGNDTSAASDAFLLTAVA